MPHDSEKQPRGKLPLYESRDSASSSSAHKCFQINEIGQSDSPCGGAEFYLDSPCQCLVRSARMHMRGWAISPWGDMKEGRWGEAGISLDTISSEPERSASSLVCKMFSG